jgi:hypothetical protein
MTSCHGYYEFFDYDLFKVRRQSTDARDLEYPRDTLMGVMVENFPRFAQLVVKAKFDRRFADHQGRFTVFVSDYWEQFSSAELDAFDVGQAKEIVASNTIQGRVRHMDLTTSQDSQLNAVDNMGLIHVWVDRRSGSALRKGNEYVGKQINAYNGIIHATHTNQVPDATYLVSPEY